MHGVIHMELQRFVEELYGKRAWDTLVERAGLERPVYTALQIYPDEHITKLVAAAVEVTKVAPGDLLEAFGEFLVPAYLSIYGSLVKPQWRTLNLLEHTESTIHRVVRRRQPGAAPPALHVVREHRDEVVITYDSPRRLCAVARGIARGVGRHYRETIFIHDERCMLAGDPACVIRVRRTP